VLGAIPVLPLRPAARLLLPLAAAGVGLQVASGLVVFAADATHLIGNPLLLWKFALVLVALANLAAFHLMAGRGMATLEHRPRVGLRVAALLSLALWSSIAILGRLIAYV
jgi:hypothetical protein